MFLPSSSRKHIIVACRLNPSPRHSIQLVSDEPGAIQWTLWVLLIGLPLGALLNGCMVLLPNSNDGTGEGQIAKHPFAAIRTQRPTQIIASATLAAGFILVVVVLHMLAN